MKPRRVVIDEIPFKTTDEPAFRTRIAKAACYHGTRCFVGWRHGDILQQAFAPRRLKMTQECQGFIDEQGFWWDRRMSAIIVARVYQAGIREVRDPLISEMLWDNDGNPL